MIVKLGPQLTNPKSSKSEISLQPSPMGRSSRPKSELYLSSSSLFFRTSSADLELDRPPRLIVCKNRVLKHLPCLSQIWTSLFWHVVWIYWVRKNTFLLNESTASKSCSPHKLLKVKINGFARFSPTPT